MRWLILLAVPALSGCALASAATTVVTAPVKIASKAVDLATTSQSERDEKRGRELREREARMGQLEREVTKLTPRCDAGDVSACRKRDAAQGALDALLQGRTPD